MTSGRRLTRVPIHLEVEYRTTGNFLVSYSTNLSKGGLFLQTDRPLPVGSQLKVKLHVPAVDDPLELEAVVAWVREAPTEEGQLAGMGIEFSGMERHYGDVIDRVVRGFKGIRILVVGGAGASRSLVTRYLHSIVACEILELTASDTLGIAAQQADLAIVDIESSGPEGFEAIRAAKTRASAPVIAIAEDEDNKATALRVGADEVIHGPPAFQDLQGAVIRTLARPSAFK